MKEEIREIVLNSAKSLLESYKMDSADFEFEIEIPKNEKFGDFSTNVALILASKVNKKPRELAVQVVGLIEENSSGIFKKVEIAGPGFINFYINENLIIENLTQIYNQGNNWGSSNLGEGKKVLIEFVSANPTGYLHFGHARNAAVGDSIFRILSFTGFNVTKEFYINDTGRQMDLLGISVFIRYKQLFNISDEIPEDGYRGDYIIEIANVIKNLKEDQLLQINEDEAIDFCRSFAYERLLNEIKNDLSDARVEFDEWYSEKEKIHHNDNGSNKLEELKHELDRVNAIFEKDDALWFKASDYGDNQDWVIVKSDGSPTYFFADIAYHYDKIKRGYEKLINVWGADHHSHVSRLKSSLRALKGEDSNLEVLLIQFVRLLKDGKEVSMSKREGSFVTLREVLNEVGCDVTRFFLLMRNSDSHLDFDLDLAKEQSSENPVYYIQYAHARIESVFSKAKEEDISPSEEFIESLNLKEEIGLIKKLLEFPELVKSSANSLAPHKIVFYLQDLASDFHGYYNRNKIISEDLNLSSARLYFIRCIQIVIRNGLNLLGVSSPRRM